MDAKFLEIAYDAYDVLVNSRQFFSSAVLEADRLTGQGTPYCDRVALHKGASILVFDFARYVCSLFTLVAPEHPRGAILQAAPWFEADSSVALLAETAGFSEAHRLAYRSLVERIGNGLSPDRLGLSVRATLTLTTIPLGQLKLVPSLIRTRCLEKGLLALRFAENDRAQYLVDIETIVFNCIGEHPRGASAPRFKDAVRNPE